MRKKRIIYRWMKSIRRKIKQMTPLQKKFVTIATISLLVGIVLGQAVGRWAGEKKADRKVEEAITKTQKQDEKRIGELEKEIYDLQQELSDKTDNLPWNLVLVNGDHPMSEGYLPELTEIEEGYSVDTRIANSLRKMLADAKEAGLQIEIASAYRSVERQEQVFGDSMKERVKGGMSYWEAFEETSLNVAIPGTSEHALGLALDLISAQYTELDKAQEQTAEAKWLANNCHKYGFILRYPSQKTHITGIVYEPWHYRYVGVEHATKIMEAGITLEEYLQNYEYTEEGGQ